jgi:ATP-dependent DNA helicase RecQ
LDIETVLDIDAKWYDEAVYLIETMDEEGKGRLKPIYDALEGEIDYGMLRCIKAAM